MWGPSAPPPPPVSSADPQSGTTQLLRCSTDITQNPNPSPVLRKTKPSTWDLDPSPSALMGSHCHESHDHPHHQPVPPVRPRPHASENSFHRATTQKAQL
ncbi:unnamed protein product [Boreogadus saida]